MAKLNIMLAVVAGLLSATILPAAATDWPLFGFDPARSNFNSAERMLTAGNVHRLRERWQIALGDVADSTPILLEHVRVGRATIPMLYQTTKKGETLGINATTGKIVWRFSTRGSTITDSTPAADPSGTAIYVPGIDGKVHKISAARGHEIRAPGFPARITRLPLTEKDASPLNVANGYLYAVTSGYYGDAPPYDGHVVAVRLSDGKATVFNSLCSNGHKLPTAGSCPDQRSGIWGRGGAVIDPDPHLAGQVYAATGNGKFDANQSGGKDYGDSLLALSPDLADLGGSYTPTNYQQLENGDTDLGSSSPGILPAQSASQTPYMIVEGGKDSMLKLLNRAALPGVGGELQEIDLPGGLFSAPAVWADGSSNPWIFLGFKETVTAYRLKTNAAGTSSLHSIWQVNPGNGSGEGSSPVIANGMVFVAFDDNIVALSATTGVTLWSSAQHGGANIGSIHWQSPIVVNGWVYCSDESGNLTAFSLR